jgi:hypothetical protein
MTNLLRTPMPTMEDRLAAGRALRKEVPPPATIAGNALVEFCARLCGRRTTLLIWAAVIAVAAAAGVGLVGSFWSAVALLLIATAAGVGAPVQQAYLH